MSQPDTRTFPQGDPCGVDVEDDGFVVDLALLARLLDVPASDVQALMREGRITSRCEKGVGEHNDQFRLTFFYGNRRACVRVDPSGRVLTQSVIDFGSKAASRAISDAARRELPGPGSKCTSPIASDAAALRRMIARHR
ncbi:MAG TPA: DUF6522 family protein [Woeseiaceae bacterium]|nr:DUF6522 family protein [Woeseiaceae bacterium]